MNITSIKEHLVNTLPLLVRITSQGSSLPILSSINMEAKNGRLFLRATNLEIGMIVSIRSAITKEGSVVIPAKILQSVVEGVSEKKINIKNREAGNIEITTKTCSTKIKGVEAGDFPLIPKLDAKPLFEISAEKFAQAIGQVLPAVAISNMRPDLAGVYMTFNGSKLHIVATDGFRLAESVIELTEEPGENQTSFIVPGQTAVEIVRVFGGTKDNLDVVVEEGQIAFKTQNIYLVSRLIDGNYPDYTQIIPQNHKTETIVNKQDLVKAIKLAAVFSQKDASDVVLSIGDKPNNIKIEAHSRDAGQITKDIPADIKGLPIKIILNHRYLMDGLNSLEGESVCLLTEANTSPVVIRANKDKKEFIYIISPIKK